MATGAYDSKCYDLAQTFLEDHPQFDDKRRRDELAAQIQRTIDEWINEQAENYEPPDPPGWEGGFADNH